MSGLVEPSDSEQAGWPDATFRYVHGLIGELEASQARIAVLEAELAGAREAFEQIEFRATNHGGWFDQPGQQFAEYCKLGHMASKAAKRIRAIQETSDAV